MPDQFAVDVEQRSEGVLMRLRGELDLVNASRLQHAVERAMPTNPQSVVVDLRELTFLDSTGLRALLKVSEQAAEIGHRFAIVRGPRQVQRLLDVTRMTGHLGVIDDPDELLTKS